MTSIAQAITSLRPEAQFVLENDDFQNIRWTREPSTPLTEAEIAAEVTRLEADYAAKQYQRDRVKEYPSIGDQLDALWKGGEAAAEMLAKVQAVKAKYPKE